MKTKIKEYVNKNQELLLQTLRELCAIPAPSHFEHKRAEYCKKWLEDAGAKGVYVDDALNVVFPYCCDGSNKITVFVAHTDTVFPDTEPMPIIEDEEYIRCPGVGDDTASLAVLLLSAKFMLENSVIPQNGFLFVCNSCEEGLGNLKGTRQIFKDYEGKIKQFISFDSNLDKLANRCVGSQRFEVTVNAQGGHSYLAFGNTNAIAQLSQIINSIYQINVPQNANSRTSYNVGIISGGTSVNTIAQNAKMLCEYRSDDQESFEFMDKEFSRVFATAKEQGIDLCVELIGERPCMGDVDQEKINALSQTCSNVIESVAGIKPKCISSSTDCNIPLSLGIPAVCIGVFEGGGMHTREEWVRKSSLPIGLESAINLMTTIS